ncbi:hypothetical protein [Vibrio diazotrophicus]|uniref:hypothetical protein n=1 Tax=Vibrio diazotrophicus TaxID=685 RepID=UPI000CAA4B62|nr:hypothetical protein [Vibrio diazotrophicus]PNH96664.1 hypothetical protein C1O24_10055 [Vibrio diazotrophicus]
MAENKAIDRVIPYLAEDWLIVAIYHAIDNLDLTLIFDKNNLDLDQLLLCFFRTSFAEKTLLSHTV